ncbi:MAG: phage holin family protein, partial [Bradyrhizobium sp.]
MSLADAPGATTPRSNTERAPPAPQTTLRSFANELASAAGARVQLFELEAQRAAWSAARMMGFAVAAAVLLVTAWLVVAAALTVAAVHAGVPWWLSALGVIAFNLLGAWLLASRIRAHAGYVSFAAT